MKSGEKLPGFHLIPLSSPLFSGETRIPRMGRIPRRKIFWGAPTPNPIRSVKFAESAPSAFFFSGGKGVG